MILAVHVFVLWNYAIKLQEIYKRRYPTRLIHCGFEKLVLDPEAEIIRVCCFLGIQKDDKMFLIQEQNSSLKEKLDVNGFDRMTIERWKNKIPKFVEIIYSTLNQKRIANYC
jgi:hypothetical protein